ncbi:uncharacterized protein LOC112512090 isoform X2 [Cynara cardunculus var. scolymus]|uniref:uncharacterized protein LOC112512090 isoform X2 n=1 Tax=Cynara cardunculus var. scolymus TaxID=59895 RepID=UPI000D62309B|nr:uncharacterized protein LOC112512090 isoform X2 [Cynara cardunculus var. scolymus]
MDYEPRGYPSPLRDFELQGYPVPPTVTGFPGTVDLKMPNNGRGSAMGPGVGNASEVLMMVTIGMDDGFIIKYKIGLGDWYMLFPFVASLVQSCHTSKLSSVGGLEAEPRPDVTAPVSMRITDRVKL